MNKPNLDGLVFIDIETTGLDPMTHDVWEIAWAAGSEPVQSLQVAHDGAVSPEALRISGYHERVDPKAVRSAGSAAAELVLATENTTLVGANPAFDAAFLRQKFGWWGKAPWKYRMIDIEAMAMQEFALDRPIGLHAICGQLRDIGFNIPAPDHSAAADVDATRAAFIALRQLRQSR